MFDRTKMLNWPTKRPRRWLASLLMMAPAMMVSSPASAQADHHADGPRSLLITYRAEPAKRPAFRQFLAHEEMAQLAAWKRQGVIAGYQILFKPVVTEDTWDAMLVLRFEHFADTAKWMAIERVSPGGLSASGLALAKPVNSYAADADWSGGDDSMNADAGAIFYVIPYEYRAEGEYRKYMDGYVLPQIKGWMREGVLTGYQIFMNRYPVGKPWDALFVLRYRDLSAFGQRETTIAKVRGDLQSDAQWKTWADNKTGIRTESENIIAEAVRAQ